MQLTRLFAPRGWYGPLDGLLLGAKGGEVAIRPFANHRSARGGQFPKSGGQAQAPPENSARSYNGATRLGTKWQPPAQRPAGNTAFLTPCIPAFPLARQAASSCCYCPALRCTCLSTPPLRFHSLPPTSYGLMEAGRAFCARVKIRLV